MACILVQIEKFMVLLSSVLHFLQAFRICRYKLLSFKKLLFPIFMKIIGAGFGRTGTLSIKYALEQLCYGPCYHMKTALTRPWQIHFWLKAIDGRNVNWKRFFRRFNATIDWPASEFYKELMGVYPDAKIILNVRDPEEWYESSLKTIYRIQTFFPWWFPGYFMKMQEKLIWKGRFKGRFMDRDFAIENFKKHVEEVKAYVPADKLLVYDVKDGWEPLCTFLDVDIPNDPFPHYHDTESYMKHIKNVKRWALVIALSGVILMGGAIAWWLL